MQVNIFTPDQVRHMMRAYDAAFDCVEINDGRCSPQQQVRMARAIVETMRTGRCGEERLMAAAILAANEVPPTRLHS
jgi:hypothetical protein